MLVCSGEFSGDAAVADWIRTVADADDSRRYLRISRECVYHLCLYTSFGDAPEYKSILRHSRAWQKYLLCAALLVPML